MFQLARPRGARLDGGVNFFRIALSFNSRAREGRDNHRTGKTSSRMSFNSRAREGRDNQEQQ